MPLDGIPSLGCDPLGSLAGIATALGTAAGIGNGTESTTSGAATGGTDEKPTCRCQVSVEHTGGVTTEDRRELVLDADACPGDGDLVASPACRETVIGALADRDVDGVRTRSEGVERTYTDESVGLLLAAGRFVERAAFHDRDLADRACRDPVNAAYRATGRAGPVARIAAESGLAAGADRASERPKSPPSGERTVDSDVDIAGDTGDCDAFRAFVGPTLSKALVSRHPPVDAAQETAYDLPTNADVRRYRTDDGPVYHLRPVAHDLDADAMATLAAAYDLLANGSVGGGPRAPGRAVRRVAGADDPVETLAAVLDRHTRGLGVLEHFFADERVSDVVVSAPVSESPVRVVVDGERTRTNVRLTAEGAASLASRFRRESGRSFSRSSPTLDASVVAETGRRVRVAGVTAPASDGVAFAFRVRDDDAWTLPRLVAVGALSPRAAAALSLAVERGAATIVAGTRGAGKTTLLSALLWELPESTRVVTIEDTPELPVEALRDHDRDVQALHTDAGGTVGSEAETGSAGRSVPPAKALRSADASASARSRRATSSTPRRSRSRRASSRSPPNRQRRSGRSGAPSRRGPWKSGRARGRPYHAPRRRSGGSARGASLRAARGGDEHVRRGTARDRGHFRRQCATRGRAGRADEGGSQIRVRPSKRSRGGGLGVVGPDRRPNLGGE